MIPKKIHILWRAKSVTREELGVPDIDFNIYTDYDCLNFIHEKAPEYASIFNSLNTVDKWYLFGYLIVYLEGGIFYHLDNPPKAINTRASLALNKIDNVIYHNFFAAEKGHPFFKKVLDEFKIHSPLTKQQSIDINGSGLMTRVYLSQTWEADFSEVIDTKFEQKNIISCLMATRNRKELIYPSISSFLSQTYNNRELIIIDTSLEPDEKLGSLPRVRYYHRPEWDNLYLGDIRNKLVEASSADYVAQWDDDDIRKFTSLGYQINAMLNEKTKVSFLKRVIIYDRINQEGFISIFKLWEATMIVNLEFLRSLMKYPSISKGEDSLVIVDMLRKLGLKNIPKYGHYANFMDKCDQITYLDEPMMFFYTIHEKNTFDENHFKKMKKNKYIVPDPWRLWISNKKITIISPNCSNFDIAHKERDGLGNVGRLTLPIDNHSNADIYIYAYVPEQSIKHINPKKTNVIFITFEYYPLPPKYVENINKFDVCIVPHEYIKDIFTRSGIKIPIFVLQQGFTRFPRYERKKKAEFVVSCLGVPVYRKNILKLYHACKRLQKEGYPIKLKLHSPARYANYPIQFHYDPSVEISYGSRDILQTAEWFEDIDVYIFPSSAEGWSYTTRESLYLGVPTITTAIPVHKEIEKWCNIIDCPESEPAWDMWHKKYEGEWLKVTIESIYKSIKNVYENYDEYDKLAIQGMLNIENMWFNSEVTEELYSICSSLSISSSKK